ncbi:MAG: hypothetical protein KFB95_00260 [Simkaniaceae bacterium]|nr:MAG: hypothetical protein KFB95_00260 [Simkaniaceae bacterium]
MALMFHNQILRILFLLLSFSAASYALPPGYPYRIITVRHGEKNTTGPAIPLSPGILNPVFTQGLDVQGYQRAAYLVGYILGIPPAVSPLFPDLIAGAVPSHPITLVGALYTGSPPGTGTWRPVQTITPLANALFPSAAITSPYNYLPSSSLVLQIADNNYPTLVSAITDGTHDNDSIALCWESNALPFMLAEVDFGITGYGAGDALALVNNKTFIKTFGTYPNLTFPGKSQGQEFFNLVFVVEYFEDGGMPASNFSVFNQRATSDFNNIGGVQTSQLDLP